MLGDGMVSLGTAVVTVSARNRNASAKIGCSSRTFPSTRSAAGVNSIVPSVFWNWTTRFSSARLIPPSW